MIKSVLIIDDEKVLTDAYALILAKSGYQVYVSNSAPDGLDIVEKHKLDLIFLDILMHDMNGIHFMQKMKPKKYPHTKIVILSNIENPEVVSAAKKLGAYKYLLKVNYTPYDLAHLVAELSEK